MHKANWFKPLFGNSEESNAKRPCIKPTNDNSNTIIPENQQIDLTDSDKNHLDLKDLSENWTDKFSPKIVADLAVHHKKIQEVQDWIEKCLTRQNGMLLLTGPSGSGKTATINVLAKHLGVEVCEWITPMDIEYTREFDSKSFTYHEKQSDKFLDFLLKASCYTSLLTNTPRIVVVEDFPNTFLKNPTEFTNILQIYKNRGKSPLIFICSDCNTGSLNMIWNLFPPNVIEQFDINQINFNPVTNSNMKAALNRVMTLMSKYFGSHYKKPDQDSLESIVNSSMGDIISAVNNLHYATLKGAAPILIKKPQIIKPQKGRKVKKKDSGVFKLETMGKDENISIMHGVGRVLNPKLMERSDDASIETYHHRPIDIAEQFRIQPDSFVGYIQENYLPHFANIESVEKAADFISSADRLMSEWREDDSKLFGLYLAVSGTMVFNRAPVSSWHPIKAPKNLKTAMQKSQEIPLIDRKQLIQKKILITDYKTYCDVINQGRLVDVSMEEDMIEDFDIEEC